AVQITDQQDAQQKFGIDRRPPGLAVAVLQSLANETQVDVLVDQPKQVVFGNVLFQPEVVKQCFRAGVLSHHDRQASGNEDQAVHGSDASLVPRSHLLIRVTFSTPTPDRNSCPSRATPGSVHCLLLRFFYNKMEYNRSFSTNEFENRLSLLKSAMKRSPLGD